ncbi:hypothetical protein LCGC14_1532820 [marine sediment metagenome]|uniref:Uncharacterized protein n=1 Tax=marine sediment metagenome TaxID=412755 RepID=A0A0F9LW97_9ZZZZ
MKTIKVSIEGTTPILMNQYNVQAELDRQKGVRTTKNYDPIVEAKKSAYYSQDGKTLIIKSEILYASILNASSFHKIGRRSAKSILAGSIRVEPMEISLGTKDYEIDTRPVVIQRARVLKSRAKLTKWKASFEIIYNEDLIANPEIVRTVLEEAGQRIGIFDFRPQKGGPYGTFKITSFKS